MSLIADIWLDFQYKPEGVETTSARTSSSGGKQNARVTEQMNMSIEEAQMILNVKKEDSMENIQKVSAAADHSVLPLALDDPELSLLH